MAQPRLGRVFRRMGLPLWTFIGVGVSGVIVSYAGNLIHGPLTEWFVRWNWPREWASIAASAAMLVLVVIVVVACSFSANRRLPTGVRVPHSGLAETEGKQGLVILVSNPNSAMYAIRYHYLEKRTLRRVWLIASRDDGDGKFLPSTTSAAQSIQSDCEKLQSAENGALDVTVMAGGASPSDAQETYDLVNRIYRTEARRAGIDASEVVADFTGGTKPMSVGMIMACLPEERTLEYVAFNGKSSSGPYTVDYQYAAFGLVG